MDTLKEVLEPIKDFLTWAKDLLPPQVTVGWVIVGVLVVVGFAYVLRQWRRK